MQSKDYDVIANQSNQINQNNNAVKTMTCEIRYIFIFECHFENDTPRLYKQIDKYDIEPGQRLCS